MLRWRHATNAFGPLRWRRVRANPPTSQNNMERTGALAVGSQAKTGAAMDGHIRALGAPAVGALEPGMTAQPGAADLDGE